MKKSLIALALALAATPAWAGEGLMCADATGAVEAHIPLGGGTGFNILDATIKATGKVWSISSTEAGVVPIIAAQSTSVDDRIYIDFADPNYEGVVASVRLFRAGEAEGVVGGTLAIADVGAWVIACGFG